jgi:hypothetical protein
VTSFVAVNLLPLLSVLDPESAADMLGDERTFKDEEVTTTVVGNEMFDMTTFELFPVVSTLDVGVEALPDTF